MIGGAGTALKVHRTDFARPYMAPLGLPGARPLMVGFIGAGQVWLISLTHAPSRHLSFPVSSYLPEPCTTITGRILHISGRTWAGAPAGRMIRRQSHDEVMSSSQYGRLVRQTISCLGGASPKESSSILGFLLPLLSPPSKP